MLAKIIPPSLMHWKSLLLLVFFVWSGSLSAQMVIKGSVRDSKGDAVPNVTVTVLGTKNVTMTNESGLFTIKAKKNDKLHFTSVGFDAKDVIVNKTAQIDIVMDNEVSKAMNEVVVVGYGTMKKKDLTVFPAGLYKSYLRVVCKKRNSTFKKIWFRLKICIEYNNKLASFNITMPHSCSEGSCFVPVSTVSNL